MADDRTTVTELITGLGALGFDRLEAALAARPPEMVSVSPERWGDLDQLHRGGAFAKEFATAWENGVAFFQARDGLRRRRPVRVEWRGGTRQPGDEPVPADLRIDHVFLVSCKYLSKIVTNSSPSAVFDRLLAGGHGARSGDWYAEVAGDAYQELYEEALRHIGPGSGDAGAREPEDRRPTLFETPFVEPQRPESPLRDRSHEVDEFPKSVSELGPEARARLKEALGKRRWPVPLRPAAARFSKAVAEASARRWEEALESVDPERVLWRLLRIGSAPYFVLGAAPDAPLRLRIGTAWDWRQHYRLSAFKVFAAESEQPVVRWQVDIESRRSREPRPVEGHVEIRWSHGKFAHPPEAKVYLDTPHHQVPGYWPLE